MARQAPGSTTRLVVLRRGERVGLTVLLAGGPAAEQGRGLGLVLRATPQGLLLAEVAEGGDGARAGLLPGDVLTHVDGAPVARPEAVAERHARLAPRGVLLLGIRRDGQPLVLALERLEPGS